MASPAIGRIASIGIGPWKGMNEKVSPDDLPPGVAANVQNLLLDESPGVAVKRQGTRNLTILPSGLPPRDTYTFTKLDGTSYLLISDGNNLYYSTDPSGAYPVAIVTGLNADGFMEFETAENKVWMTNGIDPFMSWDVTTLLKYDRTYTSTTNATSVSSTTIAHAGLTQADNYWTGMQLVFTAGANVGTTVTVTNFISAASTLTFTPAVTGAAVTDRWIVGVVIPRGQGLRYYDGHMFVSCTADNQAELRFDEISDPNTGALILIGNPRAWPAANELALNVLDQEKLYGITPILRDRIMVHKAKGLWRLERDPLVKYRLEVVSRTIGSRFPDTWAEKNNVLYFLGQDKDSLPEVYKTDMVDVSLVDPDGGVEPTLRDLKQPNSVQQNRTFTSTDDFDSGTKSTLAATENGQLAVGAFDTATEWQGDNLVSGSNVDVESTPGQCSILGIPAWLTKYDATALPSGSSPAWAESLQSLGGGISQSVAGGELTIIGSGSAGNSGAALYTRANDLSSAADAFMSVRVKTSAGCAFFGLHNGARAVRVWLATVAGNPIYVYTTGPLITGAVYVPNTYASYSLLLKSTGAFKLWKDGVLIYSGTAAVSSLNSVDFGHGSFGTADGAMTNVSPGTDVFDSVNYHRSFKGDSLGSFGGKISPLTLPDTLPSSGNIVVLNDATRVPDGLRRMYQASTLNGGTVALESLTATTRTFDFGTTDPAGYLAVTNGQAPASVVYRYQRMRMTLTRSDYALAPEVTALYSGMLWLSPAVQIGSSIAVWRSFLTTYTVPAGVDLTLQIRMATVSTNPVESSFGAWYPIDAGNNIGTILGDATPPTSRWVQLKIEAGVSSAGLIPSVDAAVLQWTDGSAANIPVRAIVHKKRYLITAATSLGATNNIIIVCDRNDQWTKFTGLNLNSLIHFKGNLYGMNAANAYVSQMDLAGVYNDYGNPIDAFLESREEDFGAAHLRKNFRYSYLEWNRADAAWSLTTSYRRSGESDYTGSGTFSFGTTGQDIRQNYPVGTVGKRIQRKYRNNVLDENVALSNEVFFFDIRSVQP